MENDNKQNSGFVEASDDLLDVPLHLESLSEPPNVGDIVYHENLGLVKYRVTENYSGIHKKQYPEIVFLEAVQDLARNEYFKPGHLSIRYLRDLQKSIERLR